MTTEFNRAGAALASHTDRQKIRRPSLCLPRPRLRAVVSRREVLGVGRVRLTFSGADVAVFIRAEAARAPGTWIKLFVPCPHAGMVGRAYTLRRVDPGNGTFDVDFVLHESGPLSSWARSSQAGDTIEFAGPRDGGFVLHPESQWIVLIGDETALPAIQAIVASVPVHLAGTVLIETEHPGQHEAFFIGPNVRLRWVRSARDRFSAGRPLVAALNSEAILPGTGQAWVAGESASVAEVRILLHEKWKLATTHIRAMGYWKSGVAHFRAEAAQVEV